MTWPIAIAGTGTVTTVGLSTAQTAASARAGIARIREIDFTDRDGNPLRAGFLEEEHLERPHHRLRGIARDSAAENLVRLVAPALREASEPLSDEAEPPALILGIARRAQLPEGGAATLLENASRQAQVRLDLGRSEVVVAGRAAGLLAIQEGCRRIARGSAPLVAGGVDSYADERLVHLHMEGRILCDEHPDGFLPGEGAGLALLARPGDPGVPRGPAALLAGMAEGFEEGHLGSTRPMRGDGLATALAALFGSLAPSLLPCRNVLASLNGETLGAKQWGIAYVRNRRHFVDEPLLVHPAEFFGDAGAAMGGILVAMAAEWLSLGKHSEPFLVWCAADEGECAAACVAPSTAKGGHRA
jgi:3-oxoacyl-[acyl-carrier-protein] synthase-1